MFRSIRNGWQAWKARARISSSAVLRGHRNLQVGERCRIGGQAEINARQGPVVSYREESGQ